MSLRSFLACAFLFCFVISVAVSIEDAEVHTESQEPSALAELKEPSDEFRGSEHIDAMLYFVDPDFGAASDNKPVSLPAGQKANIAISVINKHKGEEPVSFTLDYLTAALHYPQYYGYIIQNFTHLRLQNTLEPSQEAAISYFFRPPLHLAVQPFDLSILMSYHNNLGNVFEHSVYNRTITIYEEEEGFDTQLLFLGILVSGILLLFIIAVYHWLTSRARSEATQSTHPGTQINKRNSENEYASLANKTKQLSGTKLHHRNQGRR